MRQRGQGPAGGFEALAELGFERVGDDLPVAHLPADTGGGAVELGAGIAGAVGAAAGDFGREAIIERPRDWPSDHDDTDQAIPLRDPHPELPASGRPMVAMVTNNEFFSLIEGDRADTQPHDAFSTR
jgi:hypothetical protein